MSQFLQHPYKTFEFSSMLNSGSVRDDFLLLFSEICLFRTWFYHYISFCCHIVTSDFAKFSIFAGFVKLYQKKPEVDLYCHDLIFLMFLYFHSTYRRYIWINFHALLSVCLYFVTIILNSKWMGWFPLLSEIYFLFCGIAYELGYT